MVTWSCTSRASCVANIATTRALVAKVAVVAKLATTSHSLTLPLRLLRQSNPPLHRMATLVEGQGLSDIGAAAEETTVGAPPGVVPWVERIECSIAKSRKVRGGNFVQIGTVDRDGKPRCRTVVFRGFLPVAERGGEKALKMITDSRSEKVDHIAASPACEMVYWFSKTSEQFRIAGDLEVGALAWHGPRELIGGFRSRGGDIFMICHVACAHLPFARLRCSSLGRPTRRRSSPRRESSNGATFRTTPGSSFTGRAAPGRRWRTRSMRRPHQEGEMPRGWCFRCLTRFSSCSSGLRKSSISASQIIFHRSMQQRARGRVGHGVRCK